MCYSLNFTSSISNRILIESIPALGHFKFICVFIVHGKIIFSYAGYSYALFMRNFSLTTLKLCQVINFSAFLTVKVAYFSMAVTDKSLQPVNVTLQGNFDVYTIKFL